MPESRGHPSNRNLFLTALTPPDSDSGTREGVKEDFERPRTGAVLVPEVRSASHGTQALVFT